LIARDQPSPSQFAFAHRPVQEVGLLWGDCDHSAFFFFVALQAAGSQVACKSIGNGQTDGFSGFLPRGSRTNYIGKQSLLGLLFFFHGLIG
jgi:hypothetical protein